MCHKVTESDGKSHKVTLHQGASWEATSGKRRLHPAQKRSAEGKLVIAGVPVANGSQGRSKDSQRVKESRREGMWLWTSGKDHMTLVIHITSFHTRPRTDFACLSFLPSKK